MQNLKFNKIKVYQYILIFIVLIFSAGLSADDAFADSNPFPTYEEAPIYTTYFADGVPNHVYHITPSGSDISGTGTYANPWASLAGGQGTIAAGDLVLFHEGIYDSYHTVLEHSQYSNNRCYPDGTHDGTASDRIVIMSANKYSGYESEDVPVLSEDITNYGFSMTLYKYQVLDGFVIQGGISIYNTDVVVQNCDFSVGCAGQIDGNPAMIVFPKESPLAQNITIRNNSFHDSSGSLANGLGRDYAIIMFDSNTSSEGGAWNGNYTKIMYNNFYNFNGATSQEIIIYLKDCSHGTEIAHNRFYNSDAFAIAGFGQKDGVNVEGFSCHDNLIYNCDGLFWGWGEGIDAEWHDNVVIDNGHSASHTYGGSATYGFMGFANDHTCSQAWGNVWNNIFYVDDPGEWLYSLSATGYGWPTYVDYNAYPSAAVQGYFENANGGTMNWQQHDQIAQQTITVDANYFATVADSYSYKNSGRDDDCIGGFTFSSSEDTAPPASPQGLSVN